MKKANSFLFILVTITLSVLLSCNESSIIDPITDIKGDCSSISESIPDSIPQHLLGKLHPIKYPHCSSLQGNYVLFSEFTSEAIYLANKKTGEKKLVDFQSMLPPNMKFVFFNNAVFCPYDDNLFMIHLTVEEDTVGNGQSFVEGYHIFILNIKENTLNLVTPLISGKFSSYFGLGTWELSSKKDNNIVFLYPIGFVNIEKNMITSKFSKNQLINVSPNGKDNIYGNSEFDVNGISIFKYWLNDINLDFDPNFWTVIPEGLQFSQDGKYLMFTTKVVQMKPWVWDPLDPGPPYPPKDTIPYAQKRFLETFIVDVEKTLSAGKMVLHNIIRYRKDLCLTGVYYKAQFLTPRSYVISYRYNNSELHQLHEISIDGKILGQVTR